MKVLCDPHLPANWRPAPATVYFNPLHGARLMHEMRVPEPGLEPIRWLEDLDQSVLNVPAFLRRISKETP